LWVSSPAVAASSLLHNATVLVQLSSSLVTQLELIVQNWNSMNLNYLVYDAFAAMVHLLRD
jgi:hypothetical protein